MFADRAKIIIRSGKGGDGHVSFRRELYVPNGGPDGGDGGRGGDVIFEVDEGQNTLGEYRHKRKFKAQDGQEGGKKRCHGADGEDIVLKVPEGTVIMEAQSRKVIADMSGENRRQIVLKGGRGGKGNQHYATATMQVPKYAQPGQPAQELEVQLELKVIADVGLVGFPNVGKSTFLSRVTNAQPKIANYHFTTLSPNLGVVDTENGGFVIADIPGLIEGASEGVGLGHEFLRHIERTRVLVHIVDAASTEGRDPVDDIHKINRELEAYNPEIAARPQLIAANKIDCIFDDGEENPIDRLKAEFEPQGIRVYPISAVTGQGLKELLYGIKELLDSVPAEKIVFEQEFFPEEELFAENLPFTVERDPEDPELFIVEGPKIEKMLGYTNLDSEKGFAFFQRFLKEGGILEELEKAGIYFDIFFCFVLNIHEHLLILMLQINNLVINIINLSNRSTGRTDHMDFIFFTDRSDKFTKILHPLAQKFLIFSCCKDRQHMCCRRIIHQNPITHLRLIKSLIILCCCSLNAVMLRMIGLNDRLTRLSSSSRSSDCLCQKLESSLCAAVI